MPNLLTDSIIIQPDGLWDPEDQVREWFSEQDRHEHNVLVDVKVISSTNEHYNVSVTDQVDGRYFLEQKIPKGIMWECVHMGTYEDCCDFIRRFPGTGNDQRVRENDILYTIIKDGVLEVKHNDDQPPYIVDELHGESYGPDIWAVKSIGNADEMIRFAKVCNDGTYRVRQIPRHIAVYEMDAPATIIAEITYHSK